jgi:hypothetical protein
MEFVIIFSVHKGKGEVLVLNQAPRHEDVLGMEVSVSFTPRPLPPGEEPPVPIG